MIKIKYENKIILFNDLNFFKDQNENILQE